MTGVYTIFTAFVSPLWQIIDSGKEKTIGKLEFPLAQLLKSDNMAVEQPFPLKESGHNSTLTCKLMLKVDFPKCFQCSNVWALAVIGVYNLPVSFNTATDPNLFTLLSTWILLSLLKSQSLKRPFVKIQHTQAITVCELLLALVEDPFLSFVPLHKFQGITVFEKEFGYYFDSEHVKMKEITVKLLRIIKHTFRNTT